MKQLQLTSYLGILFLFFSIPLLTAQNNGNAGTISGIFQANGNFFQEDARIGAVNTPQYDHQLYGADAWLNLNYSNWGFDIGLRFDLFNQSNLLNPQGSYTDQGIGRWFIKKKINKLELSGGYLYDQIGSGIIFRAFERRPLLIDNALYGVRLAYDLTDDWKIKAFTGKQKQQFDVYDSIIKGITMDGFLSGGEESNWTMAPGFGIVARTIDDETMNQVVSAISTYTPVDSIGAKYNAYAFSVFNTLNVGKWTWYVEGAYKTSEVIFDPFADKLNWTGDISQGKLVNRPGNVIYTSVGYAQKGLGITAEYKRTENFTFRVNPFVTLNRGMINFLPPMTRVNTYRLTARYNAATQELGEQAVQFDIQYAPSRKLSFNVNASNITNLEGDLLYREIYTEATYKYKRKWILIGGVQMQNYNQEIYEVKPGVPIVETITPYIDFLYKLDRKKALRFEFQAMLTGKDDKDVRHDYGNWLFGQVELTMAPNWTFTISDMYNAGPGKNSPSDANDEKIDVHFPRFDVFYTHKSNRFSLSYVKQVEGVVCTGGICRLEPAFSGVKMTVNSSF